MTVVIGLHGKIKSGKTTFEDVVNSHYRGGVVFLAFADALKEACKMLAWKNKNDFFSQRGKETVISNVTSNLTEVCFDIVTFCFQYENCIQLGMNPIECMQNLQKVIRKTFKVEDKHNYQYIDFGKITAGRLLQVVGEEIVRKYLHPDLLAKIVENKIYPLHGKTKLIIVTDVRYKNEYEMVQGLPTKFERHILRIMRPSLAPSLSLPLVKEKEEKEEGEKKGRDLQHNSETSLDNYHLHTLLNDGTLEEYEEKVKSVLDDFNAIYYLPFITYK